MKKIELKKFGIASLVKVTLYFSIIPIVLMALGGLIGLLIGIASGERTVIVFGIIYMVMPIVMIGIYAVVTSLGGIIYNVLSSKFGGLEIYVNEKE